MNQFEIDTLLINGKIYTLKEEGEFVEAIGINHGRIVFAGSMADSAAYTAKNTINLKGKTALPGFGDSHLHLYAHCQNQATVSLEEARSLEELVSIMKKKAAVTEKGKWIKGTGFDHTKFAENRMPTRWDLDQISTDHPIVIRRCCLHTMVANSLAIEIAGIDQQKLDEFEDLIELEKDRNLNGIFREKATAVFDDIVPNPLSDPKERETIVKKVLGDMVSKGITVVHTYAAKIWNYEEDVAAYRELDQKGALPIRVVVSLDEPFEPEERSKDPHDKVKYGSYKLFTDGSLGSRSAALTEPYHDDPDNSGILIDKEKLIQEVKKAFQKGLQPAIHAIGDRALDITLDAVETVLIDENSRAKKQPFNEINQGRSLPVRIIHAQMVRKDQLERMKKLPVILDIQPIFLCTDLYWIADRIGKERLNTAYLWKTLMHSGLILTGGSDCPVESYDPIKGIYAAVMRQDLNGFPPVGWEPQERLSVYEAVCLFSKNIAYATGDEDVLGTIEINKFADLTILDEDPFEIKPEKLKKIQVAMTFVAGEKVFDSQSFN
ncbi:MAG: amidohydrolase [Bacillota bacterium]